MTLHPARYEVGVRELHDRLSEHLERVERGALVVVTWRGRPIAALSALDEDDPVTELEQRGLIIRPSRPRGARRGARIGLGIRRPAAALILYFDTWALVRLVVVEDGSESVAGLWLRLAPAH